MYENDKDFALNELVGILEDEAIATSSITPYATTYYAYLTFSGGSGASNVPATQHGSNSSVYIQFSLPYTTPVRSGYDFTGWLVSGSGVSAGTTRQPGGSLTVAGTTSYPGQHYTLTAQWDSSAPSSKTYYVNLAYDANGGNGAPSTQYESATKTGSEIDDVYVRCQISWTVPYKSGYVFAGWYLSTDTSANPTLYQSGQDIILWGSTSTSGQTHTLVAKWNRLYYANLHYDANEGSGAPVSQSVSSSDLNGYVTFTVSDTIPTRTGYNFTGWKLRNSSNPRLFIGGDTISLYGSTSTVGQDYTLVAQWESKISGGIWIWDGYQWRQGIVWICTNPYAGADGWNQGIVWIYAGPGLGWRQGV